MLSAWLSSRTQRREASDPTQAFYWPCGLDPTDPSNFLAGLGRIQVPSSGVTVKVRIWRRSEVPRTRGPRSSSRGVRRTKEHGLYGAQQASLWSHPSGHPGLGRSVVHGLLPRPSQDGFNFSPDYSGRRWSGGSVQSGPRSDGGGSRMANRASPAAAHPGSGMWFPEMGYYESWPTHFVANVTCEG
jgi:hypothetical protein